MRAHKRQCANCGHTGPLREGWRRCCWNPIGCECVEPEGGRVNATTVRTLFRLDPDFITPPEVDRFWSKVARLDTGCWEWHECRACNNARPRPGQLTKRRRIRELTR